jgi:Uma2 family endonuclease
MTDEKIRDYQRKARAGQDPVAELHAWVEAARKGALPHPDSAPLVERLARGELERERLLSSARARPLSASMGRQGEHVRETAFESTETFSQADFAEWVMARPPGDVARYELLNGRIIMNPPAGWPHGQSESGIVFILVTHLRERRLGRVFGSSQGFELPSGDTVAADATFVSNERWHAGPAPEVGKFLRIVPDLVVEVLSPSTAMRDRGEKKAIYERNGVREYWLVDTRARRATRFVNEGGHFDAGTVTDEGGTFRSSVLPDLSIPVRDLLGEP